MRLGKKLSRSMIDHIFSWASVAKKYSVWTACDERLFIWLAEKRKEVGRENYQLIKKL
jgi:hypothetical protein